MDSKSPYAIHFATLFFKEPEVESSYRRQEPVRRLASIRSALIILVPVICLFGLLDPLLIPEFTSIAWQTRLVLLFGVLCILGTTYTAAIYPWLQFELSVLVFILAGCNIALLLVAPDAVYYYTSLILLMMYIYFSGLRYVYGFVISTLILTCWFILSASLNLEARFAADIPLLLAGYIMTAFTGYTAEKQRRELFSQTQLMDAERRHQAQIALHDHLTKLPNRHLLDERMAQSLARANRQGTQFAVLFIDLDNFKSVNDNYGHLVGDKVLKVIAERLRAHVRAEDTAARLGGDEFVILSEGVNTERDVEIAANRLLATISRPVRIKLRRTDTVNITVTGSVGISLCPRDGDNLEDLVTRADEAMYRAKNDVTGKIRFFVEEDEPAADTTPCPDT